MTFDPAPTSTGATSSTHTATVAASPIPFRKTSVVSGSEVFGALLTTVLVLAALVALAWIARRRGWLDRWTGGAASVADGKRSLALLEVRRISRRTTLYRVSDGKQEYLLAESSAQVQISTLSNPVGSVP
jgi:hypothetical protein